MTRISALILPAVTVAFAIATYPTVRNFLANNTRTQVHRINV
ncbi:hypothetical protein [Raineyella sp. W15-4]|nr:hypothetical protein [Raineyella sp. W15-4]WOQ17385.1 hypothetical protein R0145_01330 [Raineyella sp. W15-4]